MLVKTKIIKTDKEMEIYLPLKIMKEDQKF